MPSNSPTLISHPVRYEAGNQRTIRLGNHDWALADLATAFQADQLSPSYAKLFMDHLWAAGFKTLKNTCEPK